MSARGTPGDQLVAAARDGAHGALADVADLVCEVARGVVLGHWRGRALDPAQREDVVQEALARVLEKVERTDKEVRNLHDWVRGTVHRLLLETWRKSQRVGASSGEDALARLAQEDADPDLPLVRAEEAAAVRDCLAQLPKHCRTMLLHRFEGGLRNAAIATRVAKTEKAVEQAIPRAMKLVRECLQRKGVQP